MRFKVHLLNISKETTRSVKPVSPVEYGIHFQAQ